MLHRRPCHRPCLGRRWAHCLVEQHPAPCSSARSTAEFRCSVSRAALRAAGCGGCGWWVWSRSWCWPQCDGLVGRGLTPRCGVRFAGLPVGGITSGSVWAWLCVVMSCLARVQRPGRRIRGVSFGPRRRSSGFRLSPLPSVRRAGAGRRRARGWRGVFRRGVAVVMSLAAGHLSGVCAVGVARVSRVWLARAGSGGGVWVCGGLRS